MCHAVHPAGPTRAMNPHVRAPDPHEPVAAKVGSDTICNAPESKRLRFALHAEQTTPTTIPLTLSSSLRVKGLTWGCLGLLGRHSPVGVPVAVWASYSTVIVIILPLRKLCINLWWDMRCNKYFTLILLQFVIYVCLDILGAHIWVLGFAMQNWVRQIGIRAITDCRTNNLVRNEHF